jgi:hypothetical protein
MLEWLATMVQFVAVGGWAGGARPALLAKPAMISVV